VQTAAKLEGLGREPGRSLTAALQLITDAVLETVFNHEMAEHLGYEICGSAGSALSARVDAAMPPMRSRRPA
jgi:hypothetical protein